MTDDQREETIKAFGKVVDDFRAWTDELAAAVSAGLAAVQPAINGVVAAAQGIHDAVHRAYLDAGAPYGDTHEGMMQWLRENRDRIR